MPWQAIHRVLVPTPTYFRLGKMRGRHPLDHQQEFRTRQVARLDGDSVGGPRGVLATFAGPDWPAPHQNGERRVSSEETCTTSIPSQTRSLSRTPAHS